MKMNLKLILISKDLQPKAATNCFRNGFWNLLNLKTKTNGMFQTLLGNKQFKIASWNAGSLFHHKKENKTSKSF